MRHPSGKSIAWLIGGSLLGVFGMAIADPNPTSTVSSVVVVRPAPETVFRDKIVYRLPSDCQSLVDNVHAYYDQSVKYEQQLGVQRDSLIEMYTDLSGKDLKKLDQDMREYDQRDAAYVQDDSVIGTLYTLTAQAEMHLARCQKAIKNQTN